MKPKVLLKWDHDTEVDSRSGVIVEPRMMKLFTIKMALKTIGDKAAAKVGAKLPALWVASFQADKIVVVLKIGNDQHPIGEFDLGSVADPKRRREIAGRLKDEGILDAAEVGQFMRRHPDKARLAELRQAIADKLKAMETMKNEVLSLKAELAVSGG